MRQLLPFSIEPLSAGFPFGRTLVVVRGERTVNQTGHATESRFYLPAYLHTPDND